MSAAEQQVEHVATVTHLPHVPPTVEPAVVEQAEPREPLLPRFTAYWQPPDVWSDKRPSLRDLWLHARYGQWTRQTGVLRVAGCVYAFFSLSAHALLYTLGWLVERPARFMVAATVAALALLAF